MGGAQMASRAQRHNPEVNAGSAELISRIVKKRIHGIGRNLNLELLAALPATDLLRRIQVIMTGTVARYRKARESAALVAC